MNSIAEVKDGIEQGRGSFLPRLVEAARAADGGNSDQLAIELFIELKRMQGLWTAESRAHYELKGAIETQQRESKQSRNHSDYLLKVLNGVNEAYRLLLRKHNKMVAELARLMGGDDLDYPKFETTTQARIDAEGGLAERVFLQEWARVNIRRPGINHGYGTLELIVNTRPLTGGMMSPYPHGVDQITQRDADVATAVVQWLGTNVGTAFVRQCEDIISKTREAMSAERKAINDAEIVADANVASMRRIPDEEED